MMNNLFSIFDPSSSPSYSLNWISLMILLFLLPFQFWFLPSRYLMSWHLMLKYILKESLVIIKYSYSNTLIIVSLFIIILLNNTLGLIPYIFTSTSHLSISLSLSLSLWFSVIIYSLMNYFKMLMSHLTPQNTPTILLPFMVIIESISLLIRPLTLAIRLSANMITGHILLMLIGSTLTSINNMPTLTLLMCLQIMLFILEASVSIIQAYVFTMLITLYSSEI